MPNKKKSSNNSDILHIISIIFLIIIIGVIIYLIYDTLKGKGEFFSVIKTIENYEMKLSDNANLDQYRDNEKTFQSDLKNNTTAYESSLNVANTEFSKYKSNYEKLDVTDLESQLQKTNTTISDINGNISKITKSEEIQPIITTLQTLVESLQPIKDRAQTKKSIIDELKKDNTTVSNLLKTASDNATLVIRDITQGNLLRGAFDKNYAPKVKPKIDAAKTALTSITIEGKNQTEKQILETSKDRLNKTINDLETVLNTASTKLDHTKYLEQKNDTETKKTKLDQDKKTIDGYAVLFDDMISKIDEVSSTCISYQSNLPKIKDALEKMKDVIVNYEELVKFNNEISQL
jgi:soluble cytochrome b562